MWVEKASFGEKKAKNDRVWKRQMATAREIKEKS